MPEETLNTLLREETQLSEAAREVVLQAFRRADFQKGDFLLREGTVAREVFFITSGVVRQYFAADTGVAYVCTFTLPGSFVTNIESFTRSTPSATAIDALAEGNCLIIGCRQLTALMEQLPALAHFFHTVVEALAVENAVRVRDLLSKSAEEKYQHLLDHHPNWVQQIPQQYLAQYIGIAPESLSRIRKRLLGRKSAS